MATSCLIALYQRIPDKYIAIRCNYDGMPGYTLPLLEKYYNSTDKILELLALGDISGMNEDGTVVAFIRDKHEPIESNKSKVFTSLTNLISQGVRSYISYFYTFYEGGWLAYDSDEAILRLDKSPPSYYTRESKRLIREEYKSNPNRPVEEILGRLGNFLQPYAVEAWNSLYIEGEVDSFDEPESESYEAVLLDGSGKSASEGDMNMGTKLALNNGDAKKALKIYDPDLKTDTNGVSQLNIIKADSKEQIKDALRHLKYLGFIFDKDPKISFYKDKKTEEKTYTASINLNLDKPLYTLKGAKESLEVKNGSKEEEYESLYDYLSSEFYDHYLEAYGPTGESFLDMIGNEIDELHEYNWEEWDKTKTKFKTEEEYLEFESKVNRFYQLAKELGELETDEEDLSSFEAMEGGGLEALQTVVAGLLESQGSISVLENTYQLALEYGNDFADQIIFIKNTVDLSDATEVLTQVISSAETMLDDIQVKLLSESLSESEAVEPEEELDNYEEPPDWDSVDQPEEENLEPEEEPVEEPTEDFEEERIPE